MQAIPFNQKTLSKPSIANYAKLLRINGFFQGMRPPLKLYSQAYSLYGADTYMFMYLCMNTAITISLINLR